MRRTAIVTGGAGGIGLASALRLLQDGLRVVVVDVNEGALEAAAERLAAPDDTLALKADVTDPDRVAEVVARARDAFGRIDVLVNIAGGAGPTPVRDIAAMELATWEHVIDLNLKSAFLCCRAVLGDMRAQGWGRIVNFSSTIAHGQRGPLTTVTGRLPYATAKAALLGFTSQLAKDEAEHGITVNALMPGLILSEQGTRIRDRFEALPKDVQNEMTGASAIGRAGSPEEVAAAVAFLASEQASYITGAALPVDGGVL
jgi:NAD(P)-dependent dehydrogenase (short-subunit alcohol dehydrogenase family)